MERAGARVALVALALASASCQRPPAERAQSGLQKVTVTAELERHEWLVPLQHPDAAVQADALGAVSVEFAGPSPQRSPVVLFRKGEQPRVLIPGRDFTFSEGRAELGAPAADRLADLPIDCRVDRVCAVEVPIRSAEVCQTSFVILEPGRARVRSGSIDEVRVPETRAAAAVFAVVLCREGQGPGEPPTALVSDVDVVKGIVGP